MIVSRPWGLFVKLLHTSSVWLKLLFIKGQTSYQSHSKRDEYFIGVFKVPRGEKHRLSRGIYIELGIGEPNEDDIVRYEDNYDRS